MAMRICTVCRKQKPLDEFHWRNMSKGTRRSACKACTKEADAVAYREGRRQGARVEQALAIRVRNQGFVGALLRESKCSDCNTDDVRVLEFDHLGDKEFNVSQMMTYSISRIKREIDKCQVVCANCHRIRTYDRKPCWRTMAV